jgi:hypothetical protein
VHLNT